MNPFPSSHSKRQSWFESGKSLEYIINGLQQAQSTIRIATAFFTIKGWNLVRRYTTGKKTYILVGLDDPGEQRVRLKLIKDIMKDLRTGLDRDRRQAVQDLVNKIESRTFEIVDARAKDHHNKLYICDQETAIQTSSNLTGKGLKEQVEGGNLITDTQEVLALIQEFDEYFSQADDLTQELLEILKKWLQLASPWDIYLKTLLALESLQPTKSCYPKQPVSYQIDMIAQTLQQIRAFDGAMLVASTGLGKTVVAVHIALHLRDEDLIDSLMIISPKAVANSWQKEMRSAALPFEHFVKQTFDKKSPKQDKSLLRFEEVKETIKRQRWLLIIDESHDFRNRFHQNLFNLKNKPEEKRAFIRLREFIKRGKVKVLLLTGSPYAKDIEDLNSQLYLLPHNAPNKPSHAEYFVEQSPAFAPLLQEELKDSNAWRVEDSEDFISLDSVVSQLTTPHVAKYYAKSDDQGTYIMFEDSKRYLPKVTLHTVNFSLPLEKQITELIIHDYFKIAHNNPMFKELFNRLVKVAWSSSPLALKSVLQGVADTPGGKNSYKLNKLNFVISLEERQAVLLPLIKQLEKLTWKEDLKLRALFAVLEKAKDNHQKVIVFCERRATVVYLHQEIKRHDSFLKVIGTIEKSEEEEKYNLKDSSEIEQLIKQFAPIANHADDLSSETYDVFISTDAHGVGVNMQDASIVINYDIDWTPIRPVQRAGRILRFWESPRRIDIYTFVPKINENTPSNQLLQDDLAKIQRRWNNLMLRHDEASKIIELPVLTTTENEEINLPEIASQVTIDSAPIDFEELANFEISPYYKHTANLQLHRDYAQTLEDDLVSAKVYNESEPLIYVLLLHQSKYYPILYNPLTKRLSEPNPLQILNKIACDETKQTAHVDYNELESLIDTAIESWCDLHQFFPDDVERICSLYLKPEHHTDDLQELLMNEST
jgi:superfamily II DNA or RNA helicase